MTRKKKKRKHTTKSLDYIDSSIFLGYIFEQGDTCRKYLNLVGYKNKNKGVISHYVVSEIVVSIFTKVKLDNWMREQKSRDKCFYLFDRTIVEMLGDENLKIRKINWNNNNHKIFKELRKVDRKLTVDDTFHLIEAINENCRNFITTDINIVNNQVLRNHLNKKFKLKFKLIYLT